MARFDGGQVASLEWVGVGAGALALVDGFLSWRHVSGSPDVVDLLRTLGVKTWYTAWGSGVTGWLPVLLLVGAGVLILAPGFGLRVRGVSLRPIGRSREANPPSHPASRSLLWLAMSAAALVLILIRWATLQTPDAALLQARNLRPEDVDAGASIGLYLGLAVAAISMLGAVFRVLSVVKPVTQDAPPPSGMPG